MMLPSEKNNSNSSRLQLFLKWLPWLVLILSLLTTWIIWRRSPRFSLSYNSLSQDYLKRELERRDRENSFWMLVNGFTISFLVFGITWSATTARYRATAMAQIITQALHDREEQLRTIITNAPVILFTLDISGMFTLVESQNVEVANGEISEILGRSIYEVYGEQPQLLEANNRALAGETAMAIARIGDQIFDTRWSPIKADNGTIFGVIGVATDVTERQELITALQRSEAELTEKADKLQQTLNELASTQTQLIQAEKLSSLGQLVAGIAHEINNPINFIQGNIKPANDYVTDLLEIIELYRETFSNPGAEISDKIEALDLDFIIEDLPQLLESMNIGTNRICEIVKSLRNFSRVERSDTTEADIHLGIDSTLLILNHRLKAKSNCPEIQVLKDYEDLPLVECYPGQLNQVFMNILANGIDALEESVMKGITEEPRIAIATELINGSWIRIKITDNGMGISEDVRAKLFDPFFTTKEIGKGTGLGLSISYNIVVEKHRGRLRCISTPLQGTEFVIEIPVCQSDRQAA